MGLWSFYWTQSCSWPLSSCFSSYKTQSRILFCIMWLQWDQSLLLVYFFFNGLSSVSRLASSPSIKPFSQQAYSVQTAGTTTITGERDRRTITFFLPLTPRPSMTCPHHRVVFDSAGTPGSLPPTPTTPPPTTTTTLSCKEVKQRKSVSSFTRQLRPGLQYLLVASVWLLNIPRQWGGAEVSLSLMLLR